MPDQTAVNQMVSVLDVLTKYGVLDNAGHIVDCPYTDENPDCYCAQFGKDLHESLLQKSVAAKMADIRKPIDLLKMIEQVSSKPYMGTSNRRHAIFQIKDLIDIHLKEQDD